jgi:hypothetical protein
VSTAVRTSAVTSDRASASSIAASVGVPSINDAAMSQ